MSKSRILNRIKKHVPPLCKRILIQCGHFSLLYDSFGKIVPSVYEDLTDASLRKAVWESNYIGDFPLKTFKLGIELATYFKSYEKVMFAFIVNDWQWTKNNQQNYKNSQVIDFYIKQVLPFQYERLLNKYDFSTDDIFRSQHYFLNNIYFSEQLLRKQATKKNNFCSPNSCAKEYLPFLMACLDDFDLLVSFIPESCKIPVLFATQNYLAENDKLIYHIFYDPKSDEFSYSFLEKSKLTPEYVSSIIHKFDIMNLLSS